MARDLAASGLLKADDDWDEQHPRTGSPPNPGWFAPKPKPEESTTADVDPVAYQGDFHDVVAAAEIEELRRTGALRISEARLTLGVATARIDILSRTKIGGLMGVEVKTGDDPSFTPSQIAVYFHSLLGGVSSPDAKITLLGFPPNEELPPFPIFLLYASGPNAPKRFLGPLKPPNGN